MKNIVLNNQEIPYNIVKKKNKNTYFYFKKDGYIQINLSKYQSEKEILIYMEQHSDTFVSKYQTHKRPPKNDQIYYLWGLPYDVECTLEKTRIDRINNRLYKAENVVDHTNFITQIERLEMKKKTNEFEKKYQHNGYVDIDNVHYTFRRMSTRHGSCNKVKRRISLSMHLVHLEPIFLEYVFLHEICHLKHGNHGPEFYQLLQTLCPNYKEIRKKLKEVW